MLPYYPVMTSNYGIWQQLYRHLVCLQQDTTETDACLDGFIYHPNAALVLLKVFKERADNNGSSVKWPPTGSPVLSAHNSERSRHHL